MAATVYATHHRAVSHLDTGVAFYQACLFGKRVAQAAAIHGAYDATTIDDYGGGIDPADNNITSLVNSVVQDYALISTAIHVALDDDLRVSDAANKQQG